ncbi:MAG: hypothetical protein R2822_15005 [Spirosomataceae bacterium]
MARFYLLKQKKRAELAACDIGKRFAIVPKDTTEGSNPNVASSILY